MYRDEDVDEHLEPEECLFCDAPLTEEDELDYPLVGTLRRCRTHILAVAPEMQTADQIARAA